MAVLLRPSGVKSFFILMAWSLPSQFNQLKIIAYIQLKGSRSNRLAFTPSLNGAIKKCLFSVSLSSLSSDISRITHQTLSLQMLYACYKKITILKLKRFENCEPIHNCCKINASVQKSKLDLSGKCPNLGQCVQNLGRVSELRALYSNQLIGYFRLH